MKKREQEQTALTWMFTQARAIDPSLPADITISDCARIIATRVLMSMVSEIKDNTLDKKAVNAAAKQLLHLRITAVGGRKEHPCETVKSVLKKGLGGMYDDQALEYILEFGIKYYLAGINKKAIKRYSDIGYELRGGICIQCGGTGIEKLDEVCPYCKGTGEHGPADDGSSTCHFCNGIGKKKPVNCVHEFVPPTHRGDGKFCRKCGFRPKVR
jgi:hypothetical protein